ncbi:MAG: hypothetical protein M3Y87_20420 [Myxococcota bacterium]|nr:hypothetical protein [Myxococcota bacterium]
MKHLFSCVVIFAALVGCDGTLSSITPESQLAGDGDVTRAAAYRASLFKHRWPRWQQRRDAGATTPTADAGTPMVDSDAGTTTPDDAGTVVAADAGTTARDAGTAVAPDAGTSACVGAGCTCVSAREMWRDDFETGDHSRWTSGSYQDSWGDSCQNTALSTVHPSGGRYCQRSEIVCASSSPEGVHRGYGGLQWSGDTVLPSYTNTGTGMDAPNGIVTTFHTWLEPGYSFGDGRWVSLFTINPTCGYTERVITLGLDQRDGILRSAHHWPEGTMTIEPGAPPMPLGRWVRITVYVNFYSGDMHVWQDGRSIEHVAGIARATRTMCQWHWGLYASGDNTDIAMYEDDMVVWKLGERWTDWSREPWLGETQAVCE